MRILLCHTGTREHQQDRIQYTPLFFYHIITKDQTHSTTTQGIDTGFPLDNHKEPQTHNPCNNSCTKCVEYKNTMPMLYSRYGCRCQQQWLPTCSPSTKLLLSTDWRWVEIHCDCVSFTYKKQCHD